MLLTLKQRCPGLDTLRGAFERNCGRVSGIVGDHVLVAVGRAALGSAVSGRFTSYGPGDGIKASTVNALCVAPDGSLWICGQNGVTRWVDGKFVNDIDTSAYDMLTLRTIFLDRQNAIWLSIGSEALPS